MQKELTINISDETYRGLMKLVGEKNAGQFIEAVLRPHIFESTEEFEVKIPHNNVEKKVYILSPHLVNPSDADRFEMEIVEENPDARL